MPIAAASRSSAKLRWEEVVISLQILLKTPVIVAIDGGVSADPEQLVGIAADRGADFIAISTYNGIALRYACDVARCLARAGLDLPVCIGGRLNQVPDDSNSGLPVDVRAEIRALGFIPCASLDDLV